MVGPGEHGQFGEPPFADILRALPSDQVGVAILDDMQRVALQIPEFGRVYAIGVIQRAHEQLETGQTALLGRGSRSATEEEARRLLGGAQRVMWERVSEQGPTIEEAQDFAKGTSEMWAMLTGVQLEPEAAAQRLSRQLELGAMGTIDQKKREIEEAIDDEHDNDLTESIVTARLVEICDAQELAGFGMASEYVRELATELITDPANRGVILLRNALSADEESYRLGMESLQEAAQGEGFDSPWVACQGLEQIVKHMKKQGHLYDPALRDVAFDIIAQTRTNPEITDKFVADQYIEAATSFALTLQELDIQ